MHTPSPVSRQPASLSRPAQAATRVTYSRFSLWQPRTVRAETRAQPAEPLDLDQRVRQSGEW